MTEDEIAAVHEAAHAVFAVSGEWTKLGGPAALQGPGHGDVIMSTDPEAIRRSIAADPAFDRDLPRIQLIRSLLAGPVAERILLETGRAALGEDELRQASAGDYAVISEQLGQLNPPRPGLLERLEREVRQTLAEPAIWSAVEQFAAILLDRRSLEPNEATAILHGIRAATRADLPRTERRPFWRRVLLLAFIAWEAWWAWELAAAPRPDYEMRIAAAILFGMVLPGSLIALGSLILLFRRRAQGRR